MKKIKKLIGINYILRPVSIEDAQFIIDTRLEDAERNKYINKISSSVLDQENWINSYLVKENDFYFVVKNKHTGKDEGLIGLYDADENTAEWGRWVIRKGSLAALESVYLLFKFAFETLGLNTVYCRTISENRSVVSFHDSIHEIRRRVIPNFFEANKQQFDAVEHFVSKQHFKEIISPFLMKKISKVFFRNMRGECGKVEFDHVAVACVDIQKEINSFIYLGYEPESPVFEDQVQGIRGVFLQNKTGPRVELISNLEGSNTVSPYIEKGIKIYHFAYKVANFDKSISFFKKAGARQIKKTENSVYYGSRITFFLLPNLVMFEIIEEICGQ